MQRQDVYKLIDAERNYQNQIVATGFDDKNTINDWATYIVKYLGNAVTAAGTFKPGNIVEFRKQMVKVAALAVAVLERDGFAPRHYDEVV